MGRRRAGRRNNRKARAEADQRFGRDRAAGRRGPEGEREAGRGLPGREGEGVQFAGRPGDEGDQGEGESGTGERDPAPQALRRIRPAGGSYLRAGVAVSSAKRFLSSSYFALIESISFLFSASRSSCAESSTSVFFMSCRSLGGTLASFTGAAGLAFFSAPGLAAPSLWNSISLSKAAWRFLISPMRCSISLRTLSLSASARPRASSTSFSLM